MDEKTQLMLQRLIDQYKGGQVSSPVEQILGQYKSGMLAAWEATGHTDINFYHQLKSLMQHKVLETLYRM